MDKHKELPADIHDRDLMAVIAGDRPEYRRRDAMQVLLSRGSEISLPVLRETLLSQDAPPDLRSMAAVMLGRDVSQERVLLDALKVPAEPAVLRRIAQGLGRIGSPEALDAMSKVRLKSGSRASLNVGFARSLISYRHGLGQYLIPRPADADILRFDHKKAVSLAFETLKPAEVKKIMPQINRELPAIKLSEKAAMCFSCLNSQLWLLLNEEMVGKQAKQRATESNAVMAVVLKYDHCPAGWHAFEYIFSNPNRDNTIDIVGLRPSGVITHFGQVRADKKDAVVSLQTVNSPYALPMAFEAIYNTDKVALKVTRAISSTGAAEGQIRPAVPKPA
ncbi:MAG: HEAT repeat domain-containing protein [Gammaproteobacteria bacterium]|nr:HEAT repeat domain-containing protein [Gammaproteobacteria bacterium]